MYVEMEMGGRQYAFRVGLLSAYGTPRLNCVAANLFSAVLSNGAC